MFKMVKIDASKCNGCGACVEYCSVDAIKIVEGKAVFREECDKHCFNCGACISVCRNQAITPHEN